MNSDISFQEVEVVFSFLREVSFLPCKAHNLSFVPKVIPDPHTLWDSVTSQASICLTNMIPQTLCHVAFAHTLEILVCFRQPGKMHCSVASAFHLKILESCYKD